MDNLLKQSTARYVLIGPFLDKTDGVTEETGLTGMTVYLSKGGAAQAARNSATSITYDARGYYRVHLDATDTGTLGDLIVIVNDAATHLPVWKAFTVVPAMIYDTIVAGTDYMDSQVKAIDANAVTASALATDAVTEIQSGLATSSALSTAQTSLTTIAGYLDTEVAAIKAKTDNLPSDPADASDIASAFSSVNTKLDTIDDFLDTEVAAIKAKTDLIPASPATEGTLTTIAGYLDTEVAAIKAKTDNLPSDPADASDVASAFSTVNTKLDTIDDFLDTEIAAIKTKTDYLPSVSAGASGGLLIGSVSGTLTITTGGSGYSVDHAGANLASATNLASANSSLTTIAGYVDTEIAAIKAKTDLIPASPATEGTLTTIAGYLDTEIAAIKAKTDNLPADPADASDIAASFSTVNAKLDTIDDFLDTEVAAIKAKTDNLPASPAAVGDIPTAANISATVAAALESAHGSGSWTTGSGSGGGGLDAAGIRLAIGLSTNDMDAQLSSIASGVVDIKAKTDYLPSVASGASGGLLIGSGTGTLVIDSGGIASANANVVSLDGAPVGVDSGAAGMVSFYSGEFVATQTAVDSVAAYIDTEVAAIKAKTDNLPASPAATGDIPTASNISATVAAALESAHGSGSWTTGSGGGLDAAGVRAAVGLASANLDAQLNGVATKATEIMNKTDLLPTVAAGLSGGLPIASGTGTITISAGGVVRANNADGLTIARDEILADVAIDAAAASVAAAAIKTKTDFLPSAFAGSVGGLLIGSNAAVVYVSGGAVRAMDSSGVTVANATALDLVAATADAILDDTGTTGVPLAASTDNYWAQIQLTVDGTNTRDEWTVLWYKNSIPVTSGVTGTPTIQVVKRADGADLVASASMSTVATGCYKYNEATNVVTAGEAVLVIVTATIDSVSRTFRQIITRDVAAA
jgi:cell division protein ZapA (FtsZ GTPase activity inhibitor)